MTDKHTPSFTEMLNAAIKSQAAMDRLQGAADLAEMIAEFSSTDEMFADLAPVQQYAEQYFTAHGFTNKHAMSLAVYNVTTCLMAAYVDSKDKNPEVNVKELATGLCYLIMSVARDMEKGGYEQAEADALKMHEDTREDQRSD